MKRLKPGQPITVVLLSKTWRAKTLRGGRGAVRFRLVRGAVSATDFRGTAPAHEEGIAWARGWDTAEAKALKSATALL